MRSRPNYLATVPRPGAITILLCVLLVGLLTLGAFAIGIAQMQLARVETQIVADCSSLSGACLIGETHTGGLNTPELMAHGMPQRNTILGQSGNVNPNDVVLGRVALNDHGAQVFRPTRLSPNAVKVTMRLGEGQAMTKVPLMFPFMMDIKSFGLERTSVSAKMAHDLALVMDRSSSMLRFVDNNNTPFDPRFQRAANYPHPTLSRWGVMVRATDPLFAAFAASKIEENFSLITFGSDSSGNNASGQRVRYNASDLDVALTRDPNPIKSTLRQMFDSRPIIGNTRIDAGIDNAVQALTGDSNRDYAFKTIILLTDGQQYPYTTAHFESARRAAARGITIHAIAFASLSGYSDVQTIASIGGGKSFLAPDGETLRRTFEAIAKMAPIALVE
jgi:Ca-activated chloride channel homolog